LDPGESTFREIKMLCYKDMTFCPHWETCQVCVNDSCGRELTHKVWEEAEKIGLEVCRFMDKPSCYRKIEGGIIMSDFMDKHTPLPWIAKENKDGSWVIMRGTIVIAKFHRWDQPQWNEGNAKLIVHTCNNHDKLRGACVS